MKTRYAFIIVLSLLSFPGWCGPPDKGIQFFHGTWTEAFSEANRTGKKVFVDFYAVWCGPCKQMTRDVFTDSTVGAYANANLVSLKIDAEKQETEVVEQMGLEAYPTLVLFDANGSMISKHEGALDVPNFLSFVQSSNNFEEVRASYEADPFNLQKANAYLLRQAEVDKSKLDSLSTVILDRLPTETMLSADAWNILVNYCSTYDSKAFAFVRDHARWYYQNEPVVNGFEEGYSWFIRAMITKAAETQDKSLLDKALNDFLTMRSNLGTLHKPKAYYKEVFQIQYLFLAQDSTTLHRIGMFVERHHAQDWNVLATNSLLMSGSTDPAVMKKALQFANRALALKNNTLTNYAVAVARYFEGNGALAKASMSAALRVAKPEELMMDGTGGMSFNMDTQTHSVLSLPFQVK